MPRQVWLKQPLVSVDDINARLDIVSALVEDTELRERLRDTHFRGGCWSVGCLVWGLVWGGTDGGVQPC
eukprot:359704-Chlamydomonas_euryale.AAC.3